MAEIKPIETYYNGHKFRSKLEAQWAIFFDTLGIKWYYEPEGYRLSDGTMYLPDFYLPQMDTFFEVKGVMNDKDMHKIEQFIKDANKPVVIGYPDMEFQACDDWWGDGYTLAKKRLSSLAKWLVCNGLWFMGDEGFYVCRCCRTHEGDHHFVIVADGSGFVTAPGYDEGVDQAFKNALHARFDHGQTPIIKRRAQ